MSNYKDYYSAEEVADLLDLHVRTVRRFIREGKLGATRLGKQYRISAQELSRFVGSDEKTKPPHRQRGVRVASTVDVDVVSPDEAQRITNLLMGAFHSSPEAEHGKRLECIYYEERAELRIAVHADLVTATAVLGMVNGLIGSK